MFSAKLSHSVSAINRHFVNILKIIIVKIYFSYGGIIPPRARDLHRQNIETSFEKCLREANLDPQEIDAIAVTNRPGKLFYQL